MAVLFYELVKREKSSVNRKEGSKYVNNYPSFMIYLSDGIESPVFLSFI